MHKSKCEKCGKEGALSIKVNSRQAVLCIKCGSEWLEHRDDKIGEMFRKWLA